MTWLRRFLARWRKPEQQLLEEFAQRLMEAEQPKLEELPVDLLRDIARWNEIAIRIHIERRMYWPERAQ